MAVYANDEVTWCTFCGKAAYLSHAVASKVVARPMFAGERLDKGMTKMRIYPCPFVPYGQAFHVTHRRKRVPRQWKNEPTV